MNTCSCLFDDGRLGDPLSLELLPQPHDLLVQHLLPLPHRVLRLHPDLDLVVGFFLGKIKFQFKMQSCLLLIELLLELALVVGRLGVEDGRRRGRVDPRNAV